MSSARVAPALPLPHGAASRPSAGRATPIGVRSVGCSRVGAATDAYAWRFVSRRSVAGSRYARIPARRGDRWSLAVKTQTRSTSKLSGIAPTRKESEYVSTYRDRTKDRWSQLRRQELIALGRTIVTERLESLGCTVKAPNSRSGGKLDVQTPSGRSLEVFVSTQRLGGYVFWTKRRFQPASNRFAAIVLLADAEDPDVYLVPGAQHRVAERVASPH
jgi:hypothetical protein